MHRVEITGVNTANLPKLSAKESEEYLIKIKNNDKECRERFITANLRLVLSVVQRFSRGGVSSDDLFQIGCVGLIKALDNFDVGHNVRFSTYAVPMIIGEIRRYLRDSSGIKVSRSMRDTAYKALYARENLTKIGVSEPTLMEISEEIGVSESEIACALDAVSDTISYFEPVYNDGEDGMLLMEQLSNPADNDDAWGERIDLAEAISRVPEKEKQILYLRFYEGKTQTEVSRAVGISQAQVSRLEKTAVARLRDYM